MLPVLVYQVTGSNLWTALVVVAEGVPYVLFGLFAGAVADRIDRRRLMVVTLESPGSNSGSAVAPTSTVDGR